MRQSKKEEWGPILNDWKQSGLNQTQYCKKNNIKPDLFSYYKRQIIPKSKSSVTTQKSAFTKVVISSPKQPSASLHITLPCGAVISGIHTDNLSLVNSLMGVY